MTMRVKVAAIQMTSSERVEDNCRVAEKWVTQAAQSGAKVVLLPEYWPILGLTEKDKLACAQRDLSDVLPQLMSNWAKTHHIYLIGGSIPMVSPVDGKVWNTTLVFDEAGQCVATYHKMHLFDFEGSAHTFKESRTVVAGQQIVTVNTPVGPTGLSICYDIRFPELYRAMGEVNLVVLPAAFTDVTGQAHWEVLLRARAIENQCYMLAAAQSGRHSNGRDTWGHSMLIDPWGHIVAELAAGEGVVAGEVDLDYLQDIRAKLPALQHRQRSI